jgi:beta-ketoacyl-acyl-carrier-protein synthase II
MVKKMERRVVITGLGTVCPIGNNVAEAWESVVEGVCGIDYIKNFDASNHKVKVAGEVKNLEITDFINRKDAKRMDRFTQFAVIAAKEAYADSNLEQATINEDRFGVIISSGIGGLDTIETEHKKALAKTYDRVSPFYIPMVISNLAAGTVAIELKAKGICSCVVTACAGGTDAIGEAYRLIKHGYNDVIAAGGTEAAITPLGMGGFTSMKALSESEDINRASIPFDKERSGFVMGEGAGVLIIEDYQHAINRGAKIYAEIIGYGNSCDAYHITSPLPNGEGGVKAMESALADAKLNYDKIDYINAHGTSTSINDKTETTAIRTVFKEHADKLAVSSTKSMTGHMLGATGAFEAIVCAKALQNSFIPATINYLEKDPECDLDIVPNQGREQVIEYTLSNSLGFGGHNSTIILKKYQGE